MSSQLFGVILIVTSVLAMLGMKGYTMWKAHVPSDSTGATVKVRTDTDAPAPAGVTPYLILVENASLGADPALRWEYAKKALSEANILRAENQRLNGGAKS